MLCNNNYLLFLLHLNVRWLWKIQSHQTKK
uniref:Uncharacterized protein n=1 Tax=Anguilla anguilla TaxID=7936 RepID=A0A0E9Q6A8_ANGAN